jgi:hypothetical protein
MCQPTELGVSSVCSTRKVGASAEVYVAVLSARAPALDSLSSAEGAEGDFLRGVREVTL